MASTDLRLYCLMRTDMASMNPGKAMAQAMHAQADASDVLDAHPAWSSEWREWKNQAGTFGTTIVLGGSIENIHAALLRAGRVNVAGKCLPSGLVHDPTYPLVDGSVLHLIPVNTCGWIFGPADIISLLTSDMGLHP